MSRLKLTPKRYDVIVSAIAKGHYNTTAAKLASVNPNTVAAWIARGKEDGDGIFFEFARDIAEAHLIAESFLIGTVIDAVDKGEWRAATWILERKYSERWAKKSEIALTGQGGGPVQVQPVSHDKVLAAYTKRIEASKEKPALDVGATDPMFD